MTAILATAALPRPAAYRHPLGDTGASDLMETVDLFTGLSFETGLPRAELMAFGLVVPNPLRSHAWRWP